MDWDAWARTAEAAIDVRRGPDDDGVKWKDLFAEGARFSDPATEATSDTRRIARETAEVFPDWHQEITTIRGADDWAVFEWIGHATYLGGPRDGVPGSGAPIRMEGCTIVTVDEDGLVTSWRDYLDRKQPEDQIRRFAADG